MSLVFTLMAAASARPIPVLPLVGSISVSPGFNCIKRKKTIKIDMN
jgi:hypothetical protein